VRINKTGETVADKKTIKNTTRKINWPDLVFGPVNLWSLPPADFFYRKLN